MANTLIQFIILRSKLDENISTKRVWKENVSGASWVDCYKVGNMEDTFLIFCVRALWRALQECFGKQALKKGGAALIVFASFHGVNNHRDWFQATSNLTTAPNPSNTPLVSYLQSLRTKSPLERLLWLDY